MNTIFTIVKTAFVW